MEKKSNNLVDFSKIPPEIQQHIAAYLDGSTLGFFAQSNKRIFKNLLPLLCKYQAMFPLQLAAKGHSTYLYQADQLFVCGKNDRGQLGLEDERDRHIFTPVNWPTNRGKIQQIIAGIAHTLVLTQNNQLWVCGTNLYEELESEDIAKCATFMAVEWPEERGKILQIAAGENYTLILTQYNKLWVCGVNIFGQLGIESKEWRSNFTAVSWPEERGKIQQVIAGYNHSIILTENNNLWVCGANNRGQLGLEDTVCRSAFTKLLWPEERGKILQIVTGGDHTIILSEDNRLWVSGANRYGQLGLAGQSDLITFTDVPWPKEQGEIEQIKAGWTHTILLTKDKRLWACGNNNYGQLGLKNYNNYFHFTAIPWPVERDQIQQIIAGWNHTFVLTKNNKLWGCGDNEWGQLGLKNLESCSSLTLVNMKKLCPSLQKVFTFNNNLNQLIKLGEFLAVNHLMESKTPVTLASASSQRKCAIQ